jgi:beta-aspartyl-peptidase (threonine type)
MKSNNKIAIAIHGGAGPDSEFIRQNKKEYESGLKEALEAGHKELAMGNSAIDAVESAVLHLENNPLFNCGRGSALNHKGEIEMDASIMDGKKMRAGAVSIVKNIKNPVSAARYIMEKTSHVLVSGEGAMELMVERKCPELEPASYFITQRQVDEFIKMRDKEKLQDILEKRVKGTVGAVAVDQHGNVASATSTGGTCNCHSGRIGDSALIGAGNFADNRTCAVSGTGDGEILIVHSIAHYISCLMEFTDRNIQQTCDYAIHEKFRDVKGDIGIIALNAKGEIGIAFNTEHMHRAWIDIDGMEHVHIYP